MRKVKAVFLFCMFFLALGAFAVQTGSGHEGKEEHGKAHKAGADLDEHLKELTAKLNLTTDQQTKIRAIMVEGHEQADAIKNDNSLSNEEKHNKLKATHDSIHTKVKEVLTDDQKPKFDQMVQEMMQKHEHQEHAKGEHNPR